MGIFDFAKRAIYNLTASATRKEIDKLIELLPNYPLVAWDTEEIDQISRTHTSRKIKRTPRRVKHGSYQSIYHEPIMSYAFKEYAEASRELVVVRINNDHFAFQTKGKRGAFDSDSKAKGKIDLSVGITFLTEKYQLLIDTTTVGEMYEASVNGHTICYINKEKSEDHSHMRVVRHAKNYNEEIDRLLQLAVCFGLVTKRI